MRRSGFIFKYRVRNWPECNKVLISHGSLTLWVDEQAVSTWRRRGEPHGRGQHQTHTDAASVGAPDAEVRTHLGGLIRLEDVGGGAPRLEPELRNDARLAHSTSFDALCPTIKAGPGELSIGVHQATQSI